MRRSVLLMSAMLLASAASASAQYSVTARADITGSLSPPPPTLDVRATAAGVSVRELRPPRRGTVLLERTFVERSAPAGAARTVWVRAGGGLHRERRAAVEAGGTGEARVELGTRAVEMRLERGRGVTVTKVVASNS